MKTEMLFLFSLEAFTSKIPEKTVSTILIDHDFCQIAWLAWFNIGMRVKYDRTCQWSIKIISVEKLFSLHESAQKKHLFLEIFLKESSWWALRNHLTNANFEKWWFFTLDDTLSVMVWESVPGAKSCGQPIWLKLGTEVGCDEIFQKPLWLTPLTFSFAVTGSISFLAFWAPKIQPSTGHF